MKVCIFIINKLDYFSNLIEKNIFNLLTYGSGVFLLLLIALTARQLHIRGNLNSFDRRILIIVFLLLIYLLTVLFFSYNSHGLCSRPIIPTSREKTEILISNITKIINIISCSFFTVIFSYILANRILYSLPLEVIDVTLLQIKLIFIRRNCLLAVTAYTGNRKFFQIFILLGIALILVNKIYSDPFHGVAIMSAFFIVPPIEYDN